MQKTLTNYSKIRKLGVEANLIKGLMRLAATRQARNEQAQSEATGNNGDSPALANFSEESLNQKIQESYHKYLEGLRYGT